MTLTAHRRVQLRDGVACPTCGTPMPAHRTIVDPDPSARDYARLTKQQKVHRVRRTFVEEAARSDETARLRYKDVKWLFDGQPSTGHCYDLMEVAANLDGFVYDTPGGSGGQKRVRVNLDAVNDETLVHAANNATAGGAP